MKDTFLSSLSLVKASRKRAAVLTALAKDEYLTPAEISEVTNIVINHVSNILKELRDNHLISCLNEDTKKGRLYQITDEGRKICEFISKGEQRR
jgi:DNA-binding MarR family transcriptional regulator